MAHAQTADRMSEVERLRDRMKTLRLQRQGLDQRANELLRLMSTFVEETPVEGRSKAQIEESDRAWDAYEAELDRVESVHAEVVAEAERTIARADELIAQRVEIKARIAAAKPDAPLLTEQDLEVLASWGWVPDSEGPDSDGLWRLIPDSEAS